MSYGNWGMPSIIPFPNPSPSLVALFSLIPSVPPGRFDYQFSQRSFYHDNWSGVTDDIQQEVKISPKKYKVKDSRKYSVNLPQNNTMNRTSSEVRQKVNKKKLAIDIPNERQRPKVVKSTDNSPSKRVNMEIFLEKTEAGDVLVTKVRVGKRVRWQNVKHKKCSLRYHPAIKKFQTVMSAIDRMKKYKTLNISLTKDEVVRYKAGDLLDVVNQSNPQLKPDVGTKQVNNYYQLNNYVWNAGPSTSTHRIEDYNDESSGSDNDCSHDCDYGSYSYCID